MMLNRSQKGGLNKKLQQILIKRNIFNNKYIVNMKKRIKCKKIELKYLKKNFIAEMMNFKIWIANSLSRKLLQRK